MDSSKQNCFKTIHNAILMGTVLFLRSYYYILKCDLPTTLQHYAICTKYKPEVHISRTYMKTRYTVVNHTEQLHRCYDYNEKTPLTWLSSPSVKSMRKNRMDQRGAMGIMEIPSGYATKARPGPWARQHGLSNIATTVHYVAWIWRFFGSEEILFTKCM